MYSQVSIPGTVVGKGNHVLGRVDTPSRVEKKSHRPPEMDLPRGLNYYADYSGCGHWRMIWPENLLNAYHKNIIHGSSVMISDERYYGGVRAIRIQRQATKQQLGFMKFLRQVCDKNNINLIYEIDDICLREDIPDYNKFKFAFDDNEVRGAIIEMMAMTDEMTVTCPFMKEYYEAKTGHRNITVLPNFVPRFWMGNYYQPKKIEENYRRNLTKPRILYAGSGAHFDVDNKVNQQDDFAHVVQTIAKTVDKYQWVFVGGYPPMLSNFVKAGKIEFHPWAQLYDYPKMVFDLKINAMVAPLQDNIFNRAKSNLKYLEANAFGIPIVCQDMCTYSDAQFKFKTGDEMIDNLTEIFTGINSYMRLSKQCRSNADGMWLEDNLTAYQELYSTTDKNKRPTLQKFN